MARQMKDSGVEWIGEIPQDWSVSATKYLFNIQSGTTPDSKKEEFWDGDIRWVTPADFKTNDVYVKQGRRNISDLGFSSCSLQIIPTGSIIFSKRAPVGSVVINNTDLSINQGCLACINKGQSDTKYYYYVMAIATEQYELHSSGTTFKEISAYTFSNFKLPHPPNDRQRVIADYIDAKASLICKVVDQTCATIEEYKKLKQAIITEAVTKGVRGARTMKPSGVEWIGDIPEEWKLQKAKYNIDVSHGCDPETEGDVPVYGSGASSFRTCGEFKEGPTVLIGRKGATLHIPHFITGRYWNVDTAFDVKTDANKFSLRLYYYLATAFDYKYYISQTTLPGMTQSNYLQMKIPVPPVEEQQEIAAYLDTKCAEIDRIIEKKEQLIEELGSYKKSLIYEYVTGKKEVTQK